MNKRFREVIGSGYRIVDLGCGSGQFLREVSESFEVRVGLDASGSSDEAIEVAKAEGWEFREADLNGTFPLDSQSADVLVANQVIEHIVDPYHFVQECHRVLKGNGRCVITTPNIRYLKNVARILLTGYGPRTGGGPKPYGVWDGGHIHYFTHRDLRELFEHAGFKAINSIALVDLRRPGPMRRMIDRAAATWPVRELLSGNILLWAEK